MLDPGNAQRMATYPALSFPKHNTPSTQRWKGLHLTTNGNPALTTLLTKGIQPNKKEPQLYKHIANITATNYSYYLPL
jgi:hypothetical protein